MTIFYHVVEGDARHLLDFAIERAIKDASSGYGYIRKSWIISPNNVGGIQTFSSVRKNTLKLDLDDIGNIFHSARQIITLDMLIVIASKDFLFKSRIIVEDSNIIEIYANSNFLNALIPSVN